MIKQEIQKIFLNEKCRDAIDIADFIKSIKISIGELDTIKSKGMAHGFLTLEDNTIFTYKCSEFYCKEAEDSIIWNDSSIGIKWPDIIPLLSKKDLNAKKFSSFVSPF